MTHDALGLPDDDFDYEEFVREEFDSASSPKGAKTIWWVTAILLIGVLLYFYFRH